MQLRSGGGYSAKNGLHMVLGAWSQQEQEGWDSSAWDGPEPWEKLV